MPADPVPLIGRVNALRRGKDATQPLVRAVEQRQELRVEVPEDRPAERHRDFGVRVRRPRPHQQAFSHRPPAHRGRSTLTCATRARVAGSGPLDCRCGTGAFRSAGAATPPAGRLGRPATVRRLGPCTRAEPRRTSQSLRQTTHRSAWCCPSRGTSAGSGAPCAALARQTDPGWTLTIVVGQRSARRRAASCSGAWVGDSRAGPTSSAGPAQAARRDILQLGVSAGGSVLDRARLPGRRSGLPTLWRSWPSNSSQHDVVYADEDRIDADRAPCDPRLKPGYSPDFLLTTGYVGRPLACRTQLLDGFDPVAHEPQALEHECALHACAAAVIGGPRSARCSATARAIAHRRRRRGRAHRGRVAPAWRPSRTCAAADGAGHIPDRAPAPCSAPGSPSSSPSATNRASSARASTRSVPPRATPTSSSCWLTTARSDLETATLVERLSGTDGVRVLHDPRPFNWAQLNNAAAREAGGDVLLFLNNDIEALRPGWLDALWHTPSGPTSAQPGLACCTRTGGSSTAASWSG